MAISFSYTNSSSGYCRCAHEKWIPSIDGFKIGDIITNHCICEEPTSVIVERRELTKQMYGREFNNKSSFMGLSCGQMRVHDRLHNVGWYNKAGQKLGWGDLDYLDMIRIQDALEDDELFIILSEGDSFWSFVKNVGMIGSMCSVEPTADEPGILYVATKAIVVIAPKRIYYHKWGVQTPEDEPQTLNNELDVLWVTRKRIFEICGIPEEYNKLSKRDMF